MTTMWRASDPEALSWRAWDGAYVVYNDASGDTHCIGAETASVLRRLCAGPANREALRDALSAAAVGPDGPAADECVDAVLDALIAVGLVEEE